MENEEWKPVVYANGFISYRYIVSSLGRIYDKQKCKLKEYKGRRSDYYISVRFNEPGLEKPVQALRHRVVALAFIPNPENKPEVNHIDGNKQNNKVDNLEWVTPKENNLHAYKTGLTPIQTGILTDEDVKFIRDNYKGDISKNAYANQIKDKLSIKVSNLNIRKILDNEIYYDVNYVPIKLDGRKLPLEIRRLNENGINSGAVIQRKLTNEQIIDIRENAPNRNISKYIYKMTEIYNVSPITIQNIIYGKSYKEIGGKIRVPRNKLTDEEVIIIREQYAHRGNETRKKFTEKWAEYKGISPRTVEAIIDKRYRNNIQN